MEQLTLYDYLDKEQDPIYQRILNLKQGDKLALEKIEITFNPHGLYEIATTELHESRGSIEKCYELIKEIYNQEFFLYNKIEY